MRNNNHPCMMASDFGNWFCAAFAGLVLCHRKQSRRPAAPTASAGGLDTQVRVTFFAATSNRHCCCCWWCCCWRSDVVSPSLLPLWLLLLLPLLLLPLLPLLSLPREGEAFPYTSDLRNTRVHLAVVRCEALRLVGGSTAAAAIVH